jgi:O-antigen/teichoic acid export membrane protein
MGLLHGRDEADRGSKVDPAAPRVRSRSTQVAWLSAGQSGAVLANIILFAMASRIYAKADYATLRQVFLVFDVAAPAMGLGVSAALYHLLPKEPGIRGSLVSSGVGVLLVSGALLGGLANVLSSMIARLFSNPQLESVLPWLLPYAPLVLAANAASSVFVSAGRSGTMAIASIGIGLLPAAASVVVMMLGADVGVAVGTRAACCAVVAGVVITWMICTYPSGSRRPTLGGVRSLLHVGLPLAAASVFGSVAIQVHGLVVATECTPEQYAVYVNGAFEVPVIGIITGAITSVVMAGMSASCHAGRRDEALSLFHLAAIRSASVLLPAFAFLEFFASELIEVLYSSAYAASVVPFRIMLLTLPCRIVVYGAALIALGMSRAILIRSMVDLVLSTGVAFVLVRVLGPNGGAAALVITLLAWTVPFNLRAIARGFGVTWSACLPLSRIGAILSISVLLAAMAKGIMVTVGLPPLPRLLAGAALVGPVAVWVMTRRGDLVLPGRLGIATLQAWRRPAS